MHKIPSLLISGLVLSLTSLTAHATLTTSTNNGANLVYSSISNITWTQNANLLDSLQTSLGYDKVISDIIAVSPTVDYDFIVNDTSGGIHTLTNADFFTGGAVTWYGAKAFTNYLNDISYGGLTDWTLPSMEQFGQLIQGELGDPGLNFVPDTSNFEGERSSAYWSSTTAGPTYRWQYPRLGFNYDDPLSVWAVSPTAINVGAVPVPATAWLFVSGILGVVALKRRSTLA